MKNLSQGDKIDRLCTIIPGSFSILSALLMALSVVLFPKLRTLSIGLVVIQALSEMIFNLSILAFYNPPVHGNWECKFQGWLINYGIMSSIFFSGAISAHMYFSITKIDYQLSKKSFTTLCLFVVAISTAIAALPFATNQYDDLGAQCWIVAQGEYNTTVTNGVLFRFVTHYGIIWCICIICAYCYVTIYKFVKENREKLKRNSSVSLYSPLARTDVEKIVYKLQYYPAILIFVWSGITMCRIYSSIYPDRHLANWALGSGHALLNMQGLLNGIIFFSYRTVWTNWYKYLTGKEPPPSSRNKQQVLQTLQRNSSTTNPTSHSPESSVCSGSKVPQVNADNVDGGDLSSSSHLDQVQQPLLKQQFLYSATSV